MNNYDDIINLPRFVSKNRRHMSNRDRAAQFAPFAALNGHGESISEAARLTDEFVELGELEIQQLNMKFQMIEQNISSKPEVTITYFVKDPYKKGGAYLCKDIVIRKIDLVNRIIITQDKEKYNLDDIYDVSSELFEAYL